MNTGLDGSGRTALVTGATGGIGLALAGALAATGARVAIVGRETARIADATRSISDRADGAMVDGFLADLSVQADVRRLAADVAAGMPQLDIVVHCAAVYAQRRTVTADGLETMFATNHLAPFLLTNLLQDHLTANAPARVLLLAAPSTTRLDFEDLQSERRFRPLTAFGASKAAELIFAFELARRWEGSGVTVNAVHPGLARTNLMREASAPIRWISKLVSAPPERVAATIAPLVLAPEFAERTGRFFSKGREIEAPPYTRDAEVARRLWDASVSLTNFTD